MSTNYIDSILKKLDGKIASIWISGFIEIDKIPPKKNIELAYNKLILETPALIGRRLQKLVETTKLTKQDWITLTINQKIDLNLDLPLNLGFISFNDSTKLFYLQLHHSIGDGRTFTFLIQRYLELLTNIESTKFSLTMPRLKNTILLKSLIKYPHNTILSLIPRFRLSTKRGVKLKSTTSKNPGRTSLAHRCYTIKKDVSFSKLYYAAMAYACAKSTVIEGRIRLRIPVDIRSELKLSRAFGNLCPCFSIELDSKNIKKMNKKLIGNLVARKLKQQYFLKSHHATHLEAMHHLLLSIYLHTPQHGEE